MDQQSEQPKVTKVQAKTPKIETPTFKNEARKDHIPKLYAKNTLVRISKTLSYVLRHGAQTENLQMREDGYVKVDELVSTIHSPRSL